MCTTVLYIFNLSIKSAIVVNFSDLAGFVLTLWSFVYAVFVKATLAMVAFRGRCRLHSIALCIFMFCDSLLKRLSLSSLNCQLCCFSGIYPSLFVPEISPFNQRVATVSTTRLSTCDNPVRSDCYVRHKNT